LDRTKSSDGVTPRKMKMFAAIIKEEINDSIPTNYKNS